MRLRSDAAAPPAEQVAELQDEDGDRDGGGGGDGDEDAGGGDLAGDLEAGLLGVADGPGQGVDGAVGQLGDEDDEARPEGQEAPAERADAQEGGGQGDQDDPVGVGEEAGVAADGVLQAAQAGGELLAEPAAAGPAVQTGRSSGSRGCSGAGVRADALVQAGRSLRGGSSPSSRRNSCHWVGAYRESKRVQARRSIPAGCSGSAAARSEGEHVALPLRIDRQADRGQVIGADPREREHRAEQDRVAEVVRRRIRTVPLRAQPVAEIEAFRADVLIGPVSMIV